MLETTAMKPLRIFTVTSYYFFVGTLFAYFSVFSTIKFHKHAEKSKYKKSLVYHSSIYVLYYLRNYPTENPRVHSMTQ